MLTIEERLVVNAQFKLAVGIWRSRPRIENFIKDRGQCSKIQLIRGLNIRKGRLAAAAANAVINELIEEHLIEIKPGSSGPKGGRKGVMLVWREKKPPLTEAQIQEILARVRPDVEGPISDLELETAPTPKISLDKDSDLCEDSQVAEFRKAELKAPTEPTKPTVPKNNRSALLEGLSS